MRYFAVNGWLNVKFIAKLVHYYIAQRFLYNTIAENFKITFMRKNYKVAFFSHPFGVLQ